MAARRELKWIGMFEGLGYEISDSFIHCKSWKEVFLPFQCRPINPKDEADLDRNFPAYIYAQYTEVLLHRLLSSLSSPPYRPYLHSSQGHHCG